MIVITNTSPLLNLAAIGETRLLPKLFGRVTAPNMVREEIEEPLSGSRQAPGPAAKPPPLDSSLAKHLDR